MQPIAPRFRSVTEIWQTPSAPPGTWPRPPSALVAERLDEPPPGARVCVAGLVLVRQRPGTAKGFLFLTLEDETGLANITVRPDLFARRKTVRPTLHLVARLAAVCHGDRGPRGWLRVVAASS